MLDGSVKLDAPAVVRGLLAAQFVLFVALLGLAPFAWSLLPFDGIYTKGVWDAHHASDPLYLRRCALVIFGLVASAGCSALAVAAVWRERRPPCLTLSLSLALGAVVIGWRSYPYWATGVFRATQGTARISVFDPKALIPMAWIGELWRLPVLLLYLISIVGVPLLAVTAVMALWRKAWFSGLASLTCLGTVVGAFLSSPNYLYWLMD